MQLSGIQTEAKAGQSATAPSPKLVHAAQQFEAMMLQELLKPMTEGDALGEPGGDSDSGAGSGGALSSFASQALGQALSAGGGLGIANEIVRSLSHSGNGHRSGKVTNKLHGNTGVRAFQ
jgi:peptidoglycan hydrolase FlgJ